MLAAESVSRIADEIAGCTGCRLSLSRTRTVPGEGPAPARLMLIGEGPGRQEDLAGRPFVGQAGQLLDKMLEAIHLSREAVFIANTVKCRPPENRVPAPDELMACAAFLARQIALVDPVVIVALGGTATKLLLGDAIRIGQVRGRWQTLGERAVMPTYHPAYLLRDPRQKAVVWEDLQEVARRLGIAV